MTTNLNNQIAANVRGLCAAQGKSVTDLAQTIGCSLPTARRRWHGERDYQVKDLYVLAPWLGVEVKDLLNPTLLSAGVAA